MQVIKVYVIADDYYALDSLCVFMSQDPRTRCVGRSQKTAEAMAALRALGAREKPDVVLLGIRFRTRQGKDKLDGMEFVRDVDRMRRAGKMQTKIVCLSINLKPSHIMTVLRCGADAYLDKNQATDGIVDAVVLTHRGHCVVSPKVGPRVLQFLQRMEKDVFVFPDKPRRYFGRRTREVAYLYYHAGLSANEIATKLDIAENTVRSHIKHVREVLGTSNRSGVIRKWTERYFRYEE